MELKNLIIAIIIIIIMIAILSPKKDSSQDQYKDNRNSDNQAQDLQGEPPKILYKQPVTQNRNLQNMSSPIKSRFGHSQVTSHVDEDSVTVYYAAHD